uniref:YwaF family protein n=1 Tax=Anaerococcus mediterraneensis TaxID=1870984 RepID=UPI000930A748|nr:TIGR02206 family membrane protein [Anaerococcus mediterraneensis]
MEYFFRHRPDQGFDFNMGLVRLGLIFFLIFIYKVRNKKQTLPILLSLSAIMQLVLFFWYTKDPDLFIKEGLPLYHCRIAGLMIPIAYLIKKENIESYFANLAIIGTLVAFAIPDPSKFAWPHITNITYVANHYLLIGSGLLIGIKNKKDLDIKNILIISLGMNILISMVNLKLNTNYGYLSQVPIPGLENLPKGLIFFAMTILISLVIYAIEKSKNIIRESQINIKIADIINK